ncbi:GDP-mannose 4,6-dehydratase [Massilia sp. W12]|uniref:NAD-dependent epimerase/dehydratase family protein n=1 Tax=Massilia sp. W12 TaxID=3126507 RepID=UPI0030CB020F
MNTASSGKRVLITGISGFTGRYLEACLQAAGHEVWGLSAHPGQAARHLQADLGDPDSLAAALEQAQPDWVAHLAAIAFVGHGKPDALYQTNLIGSRNLLAALAAQSKTPQAVLLASSANIYGNADTGLITEEQPPAPANDYAVSKLAMEYMARLWQDKLPLCIVRPFNYTGRGQSEQFLIPKIVQHFRRRASRIELGNLAVARDFSDVRDLVRIYHSLLQHPHSAGQTFNVCSGHATSLQQVLDLCREFSGHSLEVAVNPAFVRSNEVYRLAGDNRKLRHFLDDAPSPRLSETLEWMLQEPA